MPGAYVLAVALDCAAAGLPPGRYLYCGSAKGPGGLKARLARHMRKGKAVRWHVDRITEAGRVLGVWAFPGGDECALAQRLAGMGFPVPIPGFGSSDCRVCESHLLAWPEGAGLPWGEGPWT
ncbi:MAG: DUF123 domain-containing protein [Rhodospirillaceae bacterium]